MKNSPERGLDEMVLLLPWYAAGSLNARDAKDVERALARDSGLAGQYAMIEQECLAIIDLNESLGAPSAPALQGLFASIDAERMREPAGLPRDRLRCGPALMPGRGQEPFRF